MQKAVTTRKTIAGPDRKAAGSIPRAAKILNCLSNNINTITDIAGSCKLAKSTVHRVLKLLEESHLVIEDPLDRYYFLGPLITTLTANPLRTHEFLIRCARPEME